MHETIKERFHCPKCEKHFGHHQILLLHLKVHESGVQKSTPCKSFNDEESNNMPISNINDNDTFLTEKASNVTGNNTQTKHERLHSLQLNPPPPPPPPKKVTGLTKIRLEDCLRCDACSCIYLDENDYKKHMKNFHRQDSPKKHRKKKGCRSCCKHCNCNGNHQQPRIQTDRGNNNLFHFNIKDRWSKMVSQRLNPDEPTHEIKADPDYDPDDPAGVLDYSHLLSQVEVKIKMEPPEDVGYGQLISD